MIRRVGRRVSTRGRVTSPSEWLVGAIMPLAERLGWGRNYALGILNGWLVAAGDGFMNGSVVLTSFAAALGAPNAVIGLLPAIQMSGWMVPQLYVGSRIKHLPRKLGVYRAAALTRTLSYVWMAAASALLAPWPAVLLAAFILGMVVNSLASGVAGLPFMEVVAKVVPPKDRPAFFGTRAMIGGLLGLLAGFVVRGVLGSDLPFPYGYTVLFSIGLVLYTTGYGVFGSVDEPPDEPQEPSRFRDELRALPGAVRADRHFAALLTLRVGVALAAFSDPFFTAYAQRGLGLPRETIGYFLVTIGVVGPLSNFVWSRVNARFGSRRAIRVALAFAASAPAAAALMPPDPGLLYLTVFALTAVGISGLSLGLTNHLLALAPAATRSRYIGTTNTVVGLASFAPVLGGQLADLVGYRPLFAAGAVMYLGCWLLAARLRRDL
jgi:MFS family permease